MSSSVMTHSVVVDISVAIGATGATDALGMHGWFLLRFFISFLLVVAFLLPCLCGVQGFGMLVERLV